MSTIFNGWPLSAEGKSGELSGPSVPRGDKENRSICPREIRCDTEEDRIRDLSRYYCTFEQDSQSADSPRISPDPTLTALTQLGVHRFGCNRSFVSIIDGQQQHLIAEATASVSLRNEDTHLPHDGIFLGVRTLDLEWGVCPHAIRLFTGQDTSKIMDTENITANRTRNIIRDFTSEDFYKDRPYVQNWPYFRFYAEVPLYSPSGYVLGSYCVVDNKTRREFGDEEVAALQEIADAISQHLENVRVVHYNQRGESLVKGLTSFVKGSTKSDRVNIFNRLRETREELSFRNMNPSDSGIHTDQENAFLPTNKSGGDESVLDQGSSMTQEDGAFSLFSDAKDSRMTQPTTQPSSLAPGSPESTELLALDEDCPDTSMDDVSITEHLAAIFSRATNLLKSAMDLDGVVFLDARQSDSQFDLSDNAANQSLQSTSRHSDSLNDPWQCLEGNRSTEHPPDSSENLCRPLNHDTGIPPIDKLCPEPQLALPEELLQDLMKSFPNGYIFDLKDGTDTLQDKVSRLLAHNLPDAKSVLFMPLWDWNKSRWLAGTLVWTNDHRRPLGIEELHYFKVFGDSIISEVSRVHWDATEKSKFDFVSSISHELRSPLHGILGTTELVQSLPLQPSQHDMIKMIEISGLTLLDTIDHLLEYCKINDLATKGSGDPRAMKNRHSDFDLGVLVEEVATVLCASQQSQYDTNIPVVLSSSGSSADAHYRCPSQSDQTSVIIRIEQLDSWVVRSAAGAWKRILMNIIGNAMKWTKRGLIEVTLSKVRQESHIGSSFANEDPLSPGIGLGLSIARRLAMSLGGNIEVKSEMGAGTQVDILIPVKIAQSVEIADPRSSTTETPVPAPLIKASILGLQLHPEVDEVPTGILSVNAKRNLSIRNALMDVFTTQLGWQLSPRKFSDRMHDNVAIIEEADLSHILIEGLLHTTESKHDQDFFIVLGDKTSLLTDNLPANIIRVSPPFGPRSLCDAAERFLKIFKAPMHLDRTDLAPISALLKNQPEILTPTVDQISMEIVDCSITGNNSTQSPPLDTLKSFAPPIECSQESIRVLVVDDNDINLKIMSTFIRKIGFHYDTASNGLIALEKYMNSNQRYAFVLMDISMPVMDGLVATRKIREYEKSNGFNSACIMAVTAVASNETREAAFKAGVNDFLVKPLSLARLRELMHG
ncbi:hypothetical protein N7481_000322 [Penicillium waksmanii]|uniref:uncharacterized protein n=1 Tax=Penicillium waksmanii TaxID=69791 RepID=UPI002547B6BF|nr:uncharacterized protein N7481_000322 [Penicillium waksmanii]KAJ5999913.1 hypothetical protein N7481_000322 [Penicillium waksmanii]